MLTKEDYSEQYYNSGGEIGGYDGYCFETYLSELPNEIAEKYIEKHGDLIGKKVLIIGCAFGYTVKALRDLGVDAYGMDFSEYAISQSVVPDYTFLGDARVSQDYVNLLNVAQTNVFDLIVWEDMICCLTDVEATLAQSLSLAVCVKLFYFLDTGSNLIQWYNFKTIADWKLLFGFSNAERYFSRFNWLEE